MRDQPDVYVTGNLFFYYEQGNPRAVLAPDVFVTKGVPKRIEKDGRSQKRLTYRLWEEGQVPCLVIEMTSESTRKEDTWKKNQYARLGVEELFLFDPLD